MTTLLLAPLGAAEASSFMGAAQARATIEAVAGADCDDPCCPSETGSNPCADGATCMACQVGIAPGAGLLARFMAARPRYTLMFAIDLTHGGNGIDPPPPRHAARLASL